MLEVKIDESAVEAMYRLEIKKRLNELDQELVYWDSKELMRRTCMGWKKIQESFFFHPEFPKKKVGSRWVYPAKETEEFLLWWIDHQDVG